LKNGLSLEQLMMIWRVNYSILTSLGSATDCWSLAEADPGGGRLEPSSPLKSTKITLFSMIFYN